MRDGGAVVDAVLAGDVGALDEVVDRFYGTDALAVRLARRKGDFRVPRGGCGSLVGGGFRRVGGRGWARGGGARARRAWGGAWRACAGRGGGGWRGEVERAGRGRRRDRARGTADAARVGRAGRRAARAVWVERWVVHARGGEWGVIGRWARWSERTDV